MATLAASRLLPTPPLPLPTAMMCRARGSVWRIESGPLSSISSGRGSSETGAGGGGFIDDGGSRSEGAKAKESVRAFHRRAAGADGDQQRGERQQREADDARAHR